MGWFARRRLQAEQQKLLEQQAYAIHRKRLALDAKLLEAISLTVNTLDPSDALYDDETGTYWDAIGSTLLDRPEGLLDTEEKLTAARKQARLLALTNEFAINGHENRISYVIGTGHTYTIAWKKGEEPETKDANEATGSRDTDLEACQEVIDEFCEENKWGTRQQEILRRYDRDGEVFLRLFDQPIDGMVKVRFIEPCQVKRPAANNQENHTFGVVTEPDDVEMVTGYWIDDELVKAEDVQHRKHCADANVKRGVPLFFSVTRNLHRAERILRNMSTVAEIQSAIAMIRKHATGSSSTIQSFVDNTATVSQTNTVLNETIRHRRYGPGTILDASANTEYEFPSSGIDASKYVGILQAELRAIASRLCMPEFMLSSDASNANYASTMVAEGPAVKMFQRLQQTIIDADKEIMDRVLDRAVEAGRISTDVRKRIEVVVEPPRLESRDRQKEVAADVQLVEARVMSKRTCRIRQELDPDAEKEQIEEEQDEADPFGGLGFGPMPPGMGDLRKDAKAQGEEDEEGKPAMVFGKKKEKEKQ